MGGVINNLITTEQGYSLDARQGKILNDKIDTLKTRCDNVFYHNTLRSYGITVNTDSCYFTINGTNNSSGAYIRTPIVILVCRQDNYYCTIYGTVRLNGSVTFLDDTAKYTAVLTYNESEFKTDVSITFKSVNMWGNAIILLFDQRLSIT